MQTELITPMVHLNGTGQDDLVDAYSDAAFAVDAAIDMLAKTGPNGRDYYPLGPESLERANREHRSRIKRLHDVKSELEALCNAVVDRSGERVVFVTLLGD